jgi:undecaprenyl-diphosphatase
MASWDRTTRDKLVMPVSSRWHWLPALGAHLGDGAVWAVVGVGLLVWGDAFLRGLTLVAALAVLGATAISTAVKYSVRRPRPLELAQFYAVNYDRYSFPSGHATRMAAIATVVGRFTPALLPVGYLLALLVALCRVVVGVHYPGDVLAGLLIGFVGAHCVTSLVL